MLLSQLLNKSLYKTQTFKDHCLPIPLFIFPQVLMKSLSRIWTACSRSYWSPLEWQNGRPSQTSWQSTGTLMGSSGLRLLIPSCTCCCLQEFQVTLLYSPVIITCGLWKDEYSHSIFLLRLIFFDHQIYFTKNIAIERKQWSLLMCFLTVISPHSVLE